MISSEVLWLIRIILTNAPLRSKQSWALCIWHQGNLELITDRQTNRPIDIQGERKRGTQRDRERHRDSEKQRERQKKNREKERERERERERHTHTHMFSKSRFGLVCCIKDLLVDREFYKGFADEDNGPSA